jgi:STE24 endopeptidase
MQLAFLLAVVVGFTSLVRAPTAPVATRDLHLALAILVGGMPVLVSTWLASLLRHGAARVRLFRWLRWSEQLLAAVYLTAMVLLFLALDVSRLARANFRLDRIFGADDLVVLAVLVTPLIASWFVFARVAECQPRQQARRQVIQQARSLFLLPIVPVMIMGLWADGRRLWLPNEWKMAEWSVGWLLLSAMAFATPLLIRCIWPTTELPDGPLRSRILEQLAEHNVRVRGILRWETDGRLASIAIAGFVPSLRYLLVTDELLRRLSVEQLLTLVAHEAAHCRRLHLARAAISLVAILFAVALLYEIWPETRQFRLLAGVVAAGGLFAGCTLHARLARGFEVQADWDACVALAGKGPVDDGVLARYHDALVAADPMGRGDWLHPSLSHRLVRLRRLRQDPGLARHLHQQLVRWTVWQIALLAMLAAASAWLS